MINSTAQNIKKSHVTGNYKIYLYELQPKKLWAVTLCNIATYYIEDNRVYTSFKDALRQYNELKQELVN